jgi:hypothetical protein
MCAAAHPEPGTGGRPLSRRSVLQGGAAAALGAVVLGRPAVAGAAPVSTASLAGTDPLVAAMHVHATYSEGPGSWEQQYANCVTAGADILWQTDHDFRARALNYMGRLAGTWLPSTSGSWRQHTATFSAAGPIRLLIEASGSTSARQSLVIEERPTAFNTFRTGIQGQTFTAVFGTSRLDAGARFEVVVTLSLHPAQSGRAAGQYSLRYRFLRGASRARFTEGGGLVGVVRAPMPANGATVVLTPETDIRAIWPAMLAVDHSSWGLGFVVTSPRRGVVADVRLQSVTVARPRHDAAGVRAAQEAYAARYSPRYGVLGLPSEEVSLGPEDIAHCNVFGSPPEWALKADVDESNWRTYYRDMIGRVHGRGGVVSWNHPLGFSAGPLLSPAQQDQQRQQQFALRQADDFLGADILEVGYAVRGHQPFSQHLALWDTFSRRSRWLTGNGASDDHSGQDWRGLTNGFLTGLWAASSGEPDLVAALAGGRAFTFHPGRTPGLQLDTLVDDAVPMGHVSTATRATRTVAVGIAHLPGDCTVELVRSPLDAGAQDPGTSVVRTWAASAFGTGGTVATAVDTSTACFVRPQVRRAGTLVATGNPTWLLRQDPADGVPPARAG